MAVSFRKLHPYIAAEVGPLDLRELDDRETLDALRAGMDQYGVLVFHDQHFSDEDQAAFAERFDGTLLGKQALGNARSPANASLRFLTNVDENGEIMDSSDKRRIYQLSSRLWHTDASFRKPSGRYSLLSARIVPPVRADTEFADMRSAYDALGAEMKTQIEGLQAHHSIAYSQQLLGYEFSKEELDRMRGAIQPLVLTNPRTKRRSLYIASHITRIVDWPVPDGRLLVADLMAHATQAQFVYSHEWREGDLVIWDNLATMHRGRFFNDAKYKRDMRRVTTIETSG